MHKNFISRAVIKAFFVLSILPSTVFAQLHIVSPTPRAVYQRDISGNREITVSGTFNMDIDKIEIRAVPAVSGQGIEKPWQTLQNNPVGGVFSGNIALYQGWYTIELRATKGGTVVGRDVLERLGVGEVFIISGQSNAQGLKLYPGPGAEEDRVVYVSNYVNDSKDLLTDPPRAEFGKLVDGVQFIGPRGQTPWCWGALGDLLVKRLNMPVLFINTAWEGSAIENWYSSSIGKDTYNYYSGGSYKMPAGMPYANLRIATKTYANQYGMRAILWTQGETDALYHTSAADYRENLQNLINRLSADVGDKRITWVISRTSRTSDSQTPNIPVTSAAVIGAQNAVIETLFNGTFAGPETDKLVVNRGDGTHFVGKGVDDVAGTHAALRVLANAWNETLTASFFATVPPIAPSTVPTVAATCVTENNAVSITLPEGYTQYIWNNGQTGRTIRVTQPGTYFATVKDNFGNSIITSTVVLEGPAKPNKPIIIPQGAQQACANTGMTFSTTGTDIYTWYKEGSNTSIATGDSATILESGSYVVKAQNIFGCISDNSNASSLTVHPEVPKPVIESVGPFTIGASISTQGLNEKYSWQRPGFEADTISNVIKVLKSGNYTTRAVVVYTLGNNTITCYSDTTTKYFETVDKNDVVVYPNPGPGDYIYIESRDDIKDAIITVFDVTGRVRAEEQIPLLNSRLPIKIKNLPTGKYIVRVTAKDLTLTKQIVVR